MGGHQTVGIKLAGQDVVDGHALGGNARASQARYEARQPAACTVGQAQNVDGCLHRAGGNVDDAAKAALGHTVHRGLDQLNGGQHVRVHRLDPCFAVPGAEVACGRATGIGHDNVVVLARSASGFKHGRAPLGRGDIRCHADHLDLRSNGLQLLHGGLQCFGISAVDDQIHAFFSQSLGAAKTQALAGAADQCPATGDTKVHFKVLSHSYQTGPCQPGSIKIYSYQRFIDKR